MKAYLLHVGSMVFFLFSNSSYANLRVQEFAGLVFEMQTNIDIQFDASGRVSGLNPTGHLFNSGASFTNEGNTRFVKGPKSGLSLKPASNMVVDKNDLLLVRSTYSESSAQAMRRDSKGYVLETMKCDSNRSSSYCVFVDKEYCMNFKKQAGITSWEAHHEKVYSCVDVMHAAIRSTKEGSYNSKYNALFKELKESFDLNLNYTKIDDVKNFDSFSAMLDTIDQCKLFAPDQQSTRKANPKGIR